MTSSRIATLTSLALALPVALLASLALPGATRAATITVDTFDQVNAPNLGDNGLPKVASDITILGNGSTITRTNGPSAPFFRILHVVQGALTLVDLTVSGGRLRAPSQIRAGGGIHVTGTGSLALSTVTISGNVIDVSGVILDGISAPAGVVSNTGGIGVGGGIHFESPGTLALTDATVKDNAVLTNGGPGGPAVLASGAGSPSLALPS